MPLRLRIERELLGARIEPPQRGAGFAVGALSHVGGPDVAFRIGGDVVGLRVLLRDRPFGHLPGGLIQLDELSGPLAGGVDAPPDVVVPVHVQPPRVRRVGGGRELGPRVVGRVELDDLAPAPERDPDVVVAVGDHAVGNRMRRRDPEHRHLAGGAVPLAEGAPHDPAHVDVAPRVDGQRLHELRRVAHHVVRIHRDPVLELLRLGVEPQEPLFLVPGPAPVLRQPDQPRPIDQDLVVPVPGIGIEPLPLRARAGIQPDQPVRDPAVHQPDVAVGVETGILPVAADPIPGPARVVGPFSRTVRRQVVLDVHRLAEGLFVDRRLLLDAHAPRFAVGSEVLDDVRQQVVPVLPPEAERRRPERKQPLRVAGGILFPERAADHVIDPGPPLPLGARARGEEVLSVAGHADLLGDLLAGPRRVDLVVARVLERPGRAAFHGRPAGRDDERGRVARERAEREIDLRRVARGHRHRPRVRLEMLRAGAHLVGAGEQGDGPVAPPVRVHHVHDVLVDVAKVDLRRRERLGGGHRPRQRRRARHGRLQTDPGQGRRAHRRGAQPGAASVRAAHCRKRHRLLLWMIDGTCRDENAPRGRPSQVPGGPPPAVRAKVSRRPARPAARCPAGGFARSSPAADRPSRTRSRRCGAVRRNG